VISINAFPAIYQSRDGSGATPDGSDDLVSCDGALILALRRRSKFSPEITGVGSAMLRCAAQTLV
jgi:hypothetical protein